MKTIGKCFVAVVVSGVVAAIFEMITSTAKDIFNSVYSNKNKGEKNYEIF